jgi:hypothetical protein
MNVDFRGVLRKLSRGQNAWNRETINKLTDSRMPAFPITLPFYKFVGTCGLTEAIRVATLWGLNRAIAVLRTLAEPPICEGVALPAHLPSALCNAPHVPEDKTANAPGHRSSPAQGLAGFCQLRRAGTRSSGRTV